MSKLDKDTIEIICDYRVYYDKDGLFYAKEPVFTGQIPVYGFDLEEALTVLYDEYALELNVQPGDIHISISDDELEAVRELYEAGKISIAV